MKKSKLFSFVILLLFWIAVALTAFLLPIDRSQSFQISFGFVCVAFVMQIIIANSVIGNKTALKWKFLGLPLIYIGAIYLITQLISFILLISIKGVSLNTVWLTNSLILTFAIIAIISAFYSRDIASTTDKEIKDKTNFVKKSLLRLETLAMDVKEEQRKELSPLIEVIKYSDPASSQLLQEIEKKIEGQISQLENNITVETINQIKTNFQKRNALCKDLK